MPMRCSDNDLIIDLDPLLKNDSRTPVEIK